MKWVILLPFLVALLSARLSPNADLVKRYAELHKGLRYSNNIYEDAYMDVPDLISKYGYPVEIHSVKTTDGYILEMHRIPRGKNKRHHHHHRKHSRRIPVLIMHGLLCSSADWVVLGPGDGLAYYLVDLGYDVWLGNARGNYYSRHHARLNPDDLFDNSFWQFSWDEIGYYDIAAFIDKITSTTRQKLHYIGHSQGGTSFLVLASRRPEYNKKLISFQGLAPASFFIHNNDTLINALAPMECLVELAWSTVTTGEVMPRLKDTADMGMLMCSDEPLLQILCLSLPVIGAQIQDLNSTMLPLLLGHFPAGASMRQIAHYGQGIKSKRFQRYDFGTIMNHKNYHSPTPPDYDLSKITTPSYLYSSLADRYVFYKDVEVLSRKLPKLRALNVIKRASFTHGDFTWGIDIKEQLFAILKKTLRHAEKHQH